MVMGCTKKESTSLMDFKDYKNIKEDNIKSIEIIRYTEGGADSKIVDEDSIISTYNKLKDKKIGKETNMACEDNTTIYVFTLTDGSEYKIEIECNWVVINNDRYLLE